MTSVRAQLRRYARDGLRCAETAAGNRVYSNRFRPVLLTDVAPLDQPNLPAVILYTLSETEDHEDTAPRVYRREMEMAIECIVAADQSADNDTDDRCDELVAQVERWMFRNVTLDRDLTETRLIRTEVSPTNEVDTALFAQRIVFAVTYYESAPEGDFDELPEFTGGKIKYEVGSANGGTVVLTDPLEVG